METKGTGRLTLIQQNDTHGQMELHPELFRRNGRAEFRKVGGLARAATVANAIKRETGAAMLIDCGDAIHGSLPAMHTQGKAIVPALNAMGVDLFTPGNWEYGFGPAVLWERVGEMQFSVLACNLENANTGKQPLAASVVRELGGVRVGFVGLTSPIIPQMSPEYAAGLRFPDARERLPKCIRELREKQGADLVVLVSHLGLPLDLRLAGEVSGLDVILSGHSHDRLERPLRIGHTLVMQSGFNASFLGRLDLEVVRGAIVDYRHSLVELGEKTAPDKAVQEIIDSWLAPFREEMQEVVGTTAILLYRVGLVETTMDNLITEAYRDVTGADVGLSPGWRFGSPVPPGPITVGDLWSALPTNPDLVTVEMRGSELRNIIEEDLHQEIAGDVFRQVGGYFIRVCGLHAVFAPNNARGTRIEQLDIAGAAYDAERMYTVAGAGVQALEQAGDTQKTGMKAIDALRRYLAAHKEVHPELTGNKYIAV